MMLLRHNFNFPMRIAGDEEIKVVKTPQFADSITEGDVRWDKGGAADTFTPLHLLCSHSALTRCLVFTASSLNSSHL